MGLLIVEGTIELAQFWPEKESDGDTTKVSVERVAYAANEDPSAAETTTIFQGAKVRGKGTKEVIDKKNRITVRWQATDTAELHYRPLAEVSKTDPDAAAKRAAYNAINKNFRQHLGQTATVKLHEKIESLAGGALAIPCQVTTFVDAPNQVFDTYGRFIGDITVGNGVNLNMWMLANGWAFPTFYASMRDTEIQACLAAVKQAKGKGVWKHYSQDVSTFDWKLVYDKQPFDAKADAGPVVMPKVFRRLAAYRTNKKAKIVSGSFESYLAAKEPPETYMRVAEFLEQGPTATPHRPFSELFKNGKFNAKPQDLVFPEAPSVLVDANWKKITKWF
jgi:endonuclease YncB( thermonuclease family)